MARRHRLGPEIAKIQARLVPPEGAVPHGQTPEGAQLYRLVQRRSRAVPWYDENTPDFHRDRKEFLRLQEAERVQQEDAGSADRFWNSVESMHRVWAKNDKTGEKSYPRNKPQVYDMIQVFYLEDEGNGNVHKMHWSPPTPQEEKAAARQLAIKQLGGGVLAEQMVDGGYTAGDLLGLLGQSKKDTADSEPQADPQHLACGCVVLLDNSLSPCSLHGGATEEEAESDFMGSAMDLPEPGTEVVEEEGEKGTTYPRHIGGGWYVLANGEKFQGNKEAAVKANETVAVGAEAG